VNGLGFAFGFGEQVAGERQKASFGIGDRRHQNSVWSTGNELRS
jgi:hypothetical protein